MHAFFSECWLTSISAFRCENSYDISRMISRNTIDFDKFELLNHTERITIKNAIFDDGIEHSIGITFLISDLLPSDSIFDLLKNFANLRINLKFSDSLKPKLESDSSLGYQLINSFLEKMSNYFPNLNYLCLNDLNLVEIPENISLFTKLETLDLSNNNISTTIGFPRNPLSNLKYLSLYSNPNLKDISESLCTLTSLEYIDFFFCSITEIPLSFQNLKNLEYLRLLYNPIIEIPDFLSNLISLKYLNFIYCKIKEVNICLSALESLTEINFQGNLELKTFKLDMPGRYREYLILNLLDCPIENIEITPNIHYNKKLIFLNTFELSEMYGKGDMLGVREVIQIIKYRRNELCHMSDANIQQSLFMAIFSSKSKYFWYHEALSKIKLKLDQKNFAKKKMIDSWKSLLIKVNENLSDLKIQKFFVYLENLYCELDVESDDWRFFMFSQYKQKMIQIASNLFEKLNAINNESILTTYILKILNITEISQSEQLVFFYYLIRSINNDSYNDEFYKSFLTDSIAVLKDYIFAMTANLNGYNNEVQDYWKTITNEYIGVDAEDKNNKSPEKCIFGGNVAEFLEFFISKFTVEYTAGIMIKVLNNEINSDMLKEFIESCLKDYDVKKEYFEYECAAGTPIIKKIRPELILDILQAERIATSDKNKIE